MLSLAFLVQSSNRFILLSSFSYILLSGFCFLSSADEGLPGVVGVAFQ